MQVIGFGLSRILVERKEKLEGKLEIKSNINIDNITKDGIPISEDDAVKINFTFTLNYNKEDAKLEFKGHTLLLPNEEETKNIINDWKSQKIPDDIKVPLFNFIMSKCNIKALELEEELGIPFHIQMPKIKPSENSGSN
jgi:hypothetical protein